MEYGRLKHPNDKRKSKKPPSQNIAIQEQCSISKCLQKVFNFGILLGRLFMSKHNANVAQLVEQRTRNA